MSYQIEYTPTRKEVFKGMQLARRPIYSGRWRLLSVAHGVAVGVGILAFGFVCSVIILRYMGHKWYEAPLAYYAIAVLIAIAFIALGRLIHRRMVTAYIDSALLQGQQLTLSPNGLGFANGRSHSLTDWRDIDRLVESKPALVATLGNQGFVLPNRLLEQAGDPSEIRAQIKAWHQATRDAG